MMITERFRDRIDPVEDIASHAQALETVYQDALSEHRSRSGGDGRSRHEHGSDQGQARRSVMAALLTDNPPPVMASRRVIALLVCAAHFVSVSSFAEQTFVAGPPIVTDILGRDAGRAPLSQDDLAELLMNVECLARMGSDAAAEDLARFIQKHADGHLQVYFHAKFWIVRIHSQRGQFDQAERFLQEILSEFADSPLKGDQRLFVQALLLRGDLYARQGHYPEAMERYHAIIQAHPAYPVECFLASVRLASLDPRDDRPTAHEAILDRLMQHETLADTDIFQVKWTLAKFSQQTGDVAQSLRLCEELLAQFSSVPAYALQATVTQAEVLLAAGRYEEAAAGLTALLGASTLRPAAYTLRLQQTLARIDTQAGRYEEAIARYEALLATSPHHTVDLTLELADAYQQAGHPDRAVPLLHALLLHPEARTPRDVFRLRRRLAKFSQQTGDVALSLRLCEELLAQFPHAPAYVLQATVTQAEVLLAAGRYEEAAAGLTALLGASTLRPAAYTLRLQQTLARIDTQAGRPAEAIARYEALLAISPHHAVDLTLEFR